MEATKRREIVLWGFHPAHGNVPLKLCAWSHKVQALRQMAGWTCGAYEQGVEPKGLALQASLARGGA